MNYLANVKDLGIILSPDGEGEPMHPWDGGGIREAVITVDDSQPGAPVYYLSYDGAMPGKTHESYWNACSARSRDLLRWEKLGPTLRSSALTHPESSWDVYKDFCSASSPWDFRAGDRWYRYYLGADHCSGDGTPAFCYSTLLATADSPGGPWQKLCDRPGCEKRVCFPAGAPGSWDDATASPGPVMENPACANPACANPAYANPAYTNDPTHEKKYIMIYSGSCSGVTKRSLGLARTDDLEAADDFDKPAAEGAFWVKDPEPILPPEEDIENASVFYEPSSGLYWLFTNHIYANQYTDAVWVYWSHRLDRWDPENKAIVMDRTRNDWAHGAIGMPSVVQKDEHTLYLFYDGVPGDGTGHLDRHIGLCQISLPLSIDKG